MITRRAALLGIGAALAAPAVVRAESLMKIVVPKHPDIFALLGGDGSVGNLFGVFTTLHPGPILSVGGDSPNPSIWLVDWGNSDLRHIYPAQKPFARDWSHKVVQITPADIRSAITKARA